MPPAIILIRHAQANHNINEKYHLPDPNLSGEGLLQSLELRANLEGKMQALTDAGQEVGLILVSPMRRTIQTALLSLSFLIDKGVPVQASALWQENSDKPCDMGSAVAELREEFPMVDFSQVDPVWPDKTSDKADLYRYNKRAILERGQRALEDVRGRKEKVVVVVSHSGFMRLGVTGRWFYNADYRIFEFEDGEGMGLREWESTEKGGLGKSFEERVELGEGIPEEDKVVMEN
ncbi:histidine phosphatase superfamily [Coniochaeta sp. 2T2.1]|nr:histidine phosphatase superfamily [Coniochaeta sp. 2T2.1]